jgi:hypothetical protein
VKFKFHPANFLAAPAMKLSPARRMPMEKQAHATGRAHFAKTLAALIS